MFQGLVVLMGLRYASEVWIYSRGLEGGSFQ